MTETADILARAFYQAGCRYAFGMPGGEVLRLLRALEEAGIAFHLAKHETPAGFMAEGAYHMTGAPGILLATLGPGVTNAVNAVANAWQDRVPLLFVTGCVDPIDQEGYTHQVFDHGRFLAPVVKGSFTLVDGAVEIVVEKALRLATTSTCRSRWPASRSRTRRRCVRRASPPWSRRPGRTWNRQRKPWPGPRGPSSSPAWKYCTKAPSRLWPT
jgi:thiamine pyrophosphate-dependent acetolactate synthase large subunit-like protein